MVLNQWFLNDIGADVLKYWSQGQTVWLAKILIEVKYPLYNAAYMH